MGSKGQVAVTSSGWAEGRPTPEPRRVHGQGKGGRCSEAGSPWVTVSASVGGRTGQSSGKGAWIGWV